MRIMTTGPQARPSVNVIMGFFYLYFLLHWVTGFFMFYTKLGFSYEGVVRYYLGDPERFMNPRSFAGLLEVTHFHLFAMGLFFVVFSHLILFTTFRESLKRLIICGLASAMLTDMISGWLVRYVAKEFAWLKLLAFWNVQSFSLVLIVGLIISLLSNNRPQPITQ